MTLKNLDVFDDVEKVEVDISDNSEEGHLVVWIFREDDIHLIRVDGIRAETLEKELTDEDRGGE